MNSFALGSSKITTTIDFVEADFEACLNGYLAVREKIDANIRRIFMQSARTAVVERGNSSEIEEILGRLDVTASTAPSLIALTQTQSQWSAAFGNGMYGLSTVDHFEMTAQFMKKKFIRVLINNQKENASVQFVYKSFEQEPTQERIVYVQKEGGWRFFQYGTPFSFEETQNYTAARKRDRLTLPLVQRYLEQFGIRTSAGFFGGKYAIVTGL